MQIFLQQNNLEVMEEDLWTAVVKWAGYQSSNKKYHNFDGSEPSGKRRKLNYNDSNKDIDINNDDDDIKSNRDAKALTSKTKLLKKIAPFIRFGLMSGKFYVDHVQPLKCLTSSKNQDIYDYMLSLRANRKCGEFSIKPRYFECCKIRGPIYGEILSKLFDKHYDYMLIRSTVNVHLRGFGFFDFKGKVDIKCEMYGMSESDNLVRRYVYMHIGNVDKTTSLVTTVLLITPYCILLHIHCTVHVSHSDWNASVKSS